MAAYLSYLAAGTYFGFVLIKTEVISWYRIQEMFRFDAFHMYGVIGSAVVVGALSVWLIKRSGAKARNGETITFTPKAPTYTRYIVGGTLFGLGWALTGACPGPILTPYRRRFKRVSHRALERCFRNLDLRSSSR